MNGTRLMTKLSGQGACILGIVSACAAIPATIAAEYPEKDEFAAFIRTEVKKWAKLVKDAGIKPE